MIEKIDALHRGLRGIADRLGGLLVDGFLLLALFAIGASIVWSAIFAFLGMVEQGHASLKDILLLFIYLELGVMVGIYFKTSHMPVRYLIYVAITALTRLMIDKISVEHELSSGLIIVASAILLLALAVLVLRYGSYKYPTNGHAETAGEAR